jgi:hypothetical protein
VDVLGQLRYDDAARLLESLVGQFVALTPLAAIALLTPTLTASPRPPIGVTERRAIKPPPRSIKPPPRSMTNASRHVVVASRCEDR